MTIIEDIPNIKTIHDAIKITEDRIGRLKLKANAYSGWIRERTKNNIEELERLLKLFKE